MDQIVGTYISAEMDTKLEITSADDTNGKIEGVLTLQSISYTVSGYWNVSAAPAASFYFNGAVPNILIAGIGSTPNFQTFESTMINIGIAQNGTVKSYNGYFQRTV